LDGFDIIFKAEDDATCGGTGLAPCILDHEIEAYDETNDLLVAWVRIPVLDYNSNTTIYLYYGNALVTTATENPTGVWDSSYVGVWHLKEDPSGTPPQMKDSTSNANHGTSYGTMTTTDQVTGKIDGSLDFDGSDDEIRFSNAIIGDSTAWTITAWIQMSPDTADDRTIYSEGDTAAEKLLWLRVHQANPNVGFWYANPASTWIGNIEGTSNVEDNQPHYVAMVQRSKTNRELFVDTLSQGANADDPGTLTHNTASIGMLRTSYDADWFMGIIDEVRISTVARDACWMETEHSNQDAPGTFYTVGSQTSAVPPQYDQDSFRALNDNGDEATATWRATANTNWTQIVDKTFRVRFLVQETAGAADSNKSFQLEYSLNGGGWNDVTGASLVVETAATANVTDAVDTTQQLGSGTFVTPNAGFDEADGLVGGASLDFGGNDEVEVEYSLQIVGTDVSNGDTIQLRVKALDTYTNTPTITVTGAGTFLYRKSITIQEAEVTCASDVSNFQVMVQLTGTDFQEIEDDVDVDYHDIIFKAEDDATCGGTGAGSLHPGSRDRAL
jgi:hypothetical protein